MAHRWHLVLDDGVRVRVILLDFVNASSMTLCWGFEYPTARTIDGVLDAGWVRGGNARWLIDGFRQRCQRVFAIEVEKRIAVVDELRLGYQVEELDLVQKGRPVS